MLAKGLATMEKATTNETNELSIHSASTPVSIRVSHGELNYKPGHGNPHRIVRKFPEKEPTRLLMSGATDDPLIVAWSAP